MDRVVGDLTVWRTDEPCPVCAAGLFIVGHGEPVQVAECRLCGWSERWDLSSDSADGEALRNVQGAAGHGGNGDGGDAG